MSTAEAPGAPRLALIGDRGMLARAVREAAAGWAVTGLDLPEFDLTDRGRVLGVLGDLAPDVIVNCAAYTDVDGCEANEELATRVNGAGPGHLAEAALACGSTLVHVSTDYVFDGTKGAPYTEDDAPAPQSAYGRSKRLGELQVARSGLQRHFIVRTSWLYGPGGRNFVETMVRFAREREQLRVVADQVGCPTFTRDLARAVFRLLTPGPSGPIAAFGLYHFSNEGSCSWHGFTEAIVGELARREAVRVRDILPIATEEYPLPARRPAYSVLSKRKYAEATGQPVPHWRDALRRYFTERTG